MSKYSENKYNYLVIEGNIAAGKTSLSTLIAKKFNARLILEQFAENPFLPKFYKDPERYSFPLELSFLASRYHQLHRELTSPDLFKSFTVADYFLSKSLIFSKITLRTDEFKLYSSLFNIIHQQLPKPDLYVYLHVNVDKLLSNIMRRGRDYEQSIKADYLERLQEGYFEYLRSLAGQRVLILDINNVDFIGKKNDFQAIETAIFNIDYKKGLNRVHLP
jgi:deoxyguanosine kinase